MEYVVVPLAALAISYLTFFSGFGLGTTLLPVFAIFFPVNIAIALTAIVHLFNNLFKLVLVGKYADKGVALWFGLAAIIASLLGALALSQLVNLPPLFTYHFLGRDFSVTPVKLTVSFLILFFALWEVLPALRRVSFGRRYLPLGGFLSGFFGGLTGQQGALRSAFLARQSLTPEGFIGTSTVISILVDIPRIAVYATHFSLASAAHGTTLLVAATLAAFLGAFLASRRVEKVTTRFIQAIVSAMLFVVALALAVGLI